MRKKKWVYCEDFDTYDLSYGKLILAYFTQVGNKITLFDNLTNTKPISFTTTGSLDKDKRKVEKMLIKRCETLLKEKILSQKSLNKVSDILITLRNH